ncbi:MAG: MATE family efflux transporter, partial [Bacteroides sp.]|nr:MATE family efflux transporter [Bacteroides sp.]
METKAYIPHYKALWRLGIPIVIGQIGMIVLGFADTLMIGHYGTSELAAASFVNNMFNLVIIFSTGFSYGLTPIVGALFGGNDKQGVGRTLKNSLAANGCVAMLLTALMTLLYLNLHRLGQPEELLPLIRPYFMVLLLSLVFVLLFNAFKQFADGITDTRTPMWLLLGGNVVNILGNWALIYGHFGLPEMGLTGAGISTLFSRILMLAVFALIFFKAKRYRMYKEGFVKGCVNRTDFKKLNALGWPVGLQMGMETASFSLATIMVGWLGTVQLAAHQVMLTISQLGFMMYYGMAAAVAVRVSNFKGQNDVRNIRRSADAGFHLILFMAVVVSVPLFLLRNELGGWFTDNAEVTQMVAGLVIPFIIYQIGDGLQCNFSNALRGIADVKPVMLIAFIAYFLVSLPSGYFFGFILDWGLTGVWMSFPFGLTTAGLLFYLRFR